MKKLILAALVMAPLAAVAADYEIDPSHTSATFSIRHMMVTNVKGQFGKVAGKVVIDEKDLNKSSAEATIEAATIDTKDKKRDDHLRSPDFFDVEKHPNITFKSTKWEKGGGEGRYKVTGDMTIRGVTRPVTLEVEELTPEVKDPWGNVKRGAVATAVINRKDFGLVWNKKLEKGGVLVGDEVKITLDVQLLRQKPAPPAPAKAKDPTR